MLAVVLGRDSVFIRPFPLVGPGLSLTIEAAGPPECLTSWGLSEIRMNPLLSMTKQSRSWEETQKEVKARPCR